MSDKAEKISLWKRFGLACLRSPINTLFAVAILGQLAYIYVLGHDDFYFKMVLVGIILLWLLWIVAKYVLTLLLVIGLLGIGAYLYYDYSHKEINKCEESGRHWNKATKKCEDREPTMVEKLEKQWEDLKKQALDHLL